MNDDVELLQSYVVHRDETAFRQLVERHLPAVYSAALRQVHGDNHLAEDVAQNVFRDLAQDAANFSPDVIVAGWLYRATQFAAAKAVRTEKRRRDRDAVAALGYDAQVVDVYSDDHSSDWDLLQVRLDEALNELAETDRDAILLRFFRGLDFRAVGVALDISDDTAQKRVTRALERLRRLLAQRGVALSVTVLGALIADKAVAAPPVGLAAAIGGGIKFTTASGAAAASNGFFAKLGGASLQQKAACGAGVVAAGAMILVLLLNRGSPPIVTYDLSRDFPTSLNATSVWSFGWTPALGGTFTRLGHLKRLSSDNGVPLAAWMFDATNLPGVTRNMGTKIAVSAGGAFVAPPGTIWFNAGTEDSPRNFCIIRFTVPPGGRARYRLTTGVRPFLDGSLSKHINFHVLKNGKQLFNRFLDPNSSAAYSDVMKLSPGDTIDFVAERGRNQKDEGSSMKIHATLTTDLSAPKEELKHALAVAPLILSPPENQSGPAGDTVEFAASIGGSLPMHYQWWSGRSPIPGATNRVFSLSGIRDEHVGSYCVTVSNAVGVVTSSMARLTITTCAPIPSGLVCWWSAEDSAGDRFGGQHGTRLSGTTFAPGRIGRALLFQGEEAGVLIPASPSLDVGSGDGFTIEAWIKPATLAGQLPLVGWNSDVASGVNLSVFNGRLYANLRDDAEIPHRVTSPAGTVVANQWQHIALTFDAKEQNARLYCRGEIVAEEHTEAFVPNTKFDLQFGRRREGDRVLAYAGLMDEIALYHRALSPEEIAAIASAGSAGKCVSRPDGMSKR